MNRKKQRTWQTFAVIALCVVVIAYIGFQAYRSVFSQVDTELAVMHSVFESIETEGLVYRTETVIPATNSEHVYYVIENGTRVAKNNVIASVYGDADSGRIEQEIEQIDQQIAAFKSVLADASSGRFTLDVINKQTQDSLYKLIQDTEIGNFSDSVSAQFEILTLLSKRQFVTGKPVDFSAKIRELEAQKKELQAKYHSPKSKIYAPVAGYFADRTDGYETILKPEELTNLTVSTLQNHFQHKPSTQSANGGKIVSGYEWYMACVLPMSYYNELAVGKSLSLRMSFVLDESVPATVYACNKDNNGNIAVVFRCDYMSEELATIRKETVEIQLVEHTGLKVPRRAIVVNKDGQPGVYIRSGNIVAFRKIEYQFADPAEYVICKVKEEEGYLRMYDDIIVGGRELYEGKVIG